MSLSDFSGFPEFLGFSGGREPKTVELLSKRGHRVDYHASIDSTQTEAIRLARSGAEAGRIVLAEDQSSGRGRHGRNWTSSPGDDLCFSILLRPWLSPANMQLVNFAASLAVCYAADPLIRDKTKIPLIKWPNDVAIAERKFCGIICECSGTHEKLDYVVIGIGVNVNNSPDDIGMTTDASKPAPTSLAAESGSRVDRCVLLSSIVDHLDSMVDMIEKGRSDELLDLYVKRSSTIGTLVNVIKDDGTERGQAIGITPQGALVVRVEQPDGGEPVDKVFSAVDVIHLRKERS